MNITYIVEIEYHDNNIYILKFFQKNHRHSDNRYSLVNSKKFLDHHNTTGTKNFLLILNTVLKIYLDIYESNKKSSFGFMGAPTVMELDPDRTSNKINVDGTVEKTKRFNAYSIYVKRYFSPENFEHIEIPTSSCYLVKSKKNTALTKERIEVFFENYIATYC